MGRNNNRGGRGNNRRGNNNSGGYKGNRGGGSRSRNNKGGSSRGGNRNNFRNRRRGNRGGRGRGRGRGRAPSTVNPQKYVVKARPIESEETHMVTKTFAELNLHEQLLANIEKKGFTNLTEVQEATMPIILNGENILGISPTGSGKTAAFLIPTINKILTDANQKVLVIAPTRELAMQIEKEAISLVLGTKVWVTRVIGGESIYRQEKSLKRNPQVVIGTPGRLKDMVDRGALNLRDFNNVVLDEVDRMLDMGFVDEIRGVMLQVHPDKQSLFFSATIDKRVEGITTQLADHIKEVRFKQNQSVDNIEQDILPYAHHDEKPIILEDILDRDEVEKVLIFVETKRGVDKVEKLLRQKGHRAAAIHGDKSQSKRKRVIQDYRDNRFQILLATNVASRGLDVSDITHVINYDEPQNYEEYVHRVGRTGRNGKRGTAYTFVEKRRLV